MARQTELASLIPQVFFDIIGRVIPGVVVLVVFALVYLGFEGYWSMLKEWLGPSASPKTQLPSTTILFLLSFVTSYALSIFLWGLRYGWNYFSANKLSNGAIMDYETGIKFSTEDEREAYYENYCLIKKENPEAGARITKLKAENHMVMTLSSGILLALIANLTFFIEDPGIERAWLSGALILLLLGVELARIHFRDHMKESIKYVRKTCNT